MAQFNFAQTGLTIRTMWKILLSIFVFGAIAGPFIAVALGALALVIAAVLAVVAAVCALLWAGTKGMWRWALAQPDAAPQPAGRPPVPEGLPLVAPRYPHLQFADANAVGGGADAASGAGGAALFDQYRSRHQGRGVGRALVLDTRANGRPERS